MAKLAVQPHYEVLAGMKMILFQDFPRPSLELYTQNVHTCGQWNHCAVVPVFFLSSLGREKRMVGDFVYRWSSSILLDVESLGHTTPKDENRILTNYSYHAHQRLRIGIFQFITRENPAGKSEKMSTSYQDSVQF